MAHYLEVREFGPDDVSSFSASHSQDRTRDAQSMMVAIQHW